MSPGDGRRFAIALALATLASLAVVWLPRPLALQDLPQHLFMAQVLASYGDPAWRWAETYQASLAFAPYAAFYGLTSWLAPALGVDAAARVFFSLCLLALTLAAARAWVRRPGSPPWLLLLLFPAYFGPVWYLGFANYLASLPLLLLALQEIGTAGREAPRPAAKARLALLVLLLFLCHPHTLLAFVGLAAVTALVERGEGPGRLAAGGAALALALVAGWLALAGREVAAGGPGAWTLRWLEPAELLRWALLGFTGLRWNGGIDPLPASAWAAAALLIAWAARRGGMDRSFVRHAAVVVATYLAAPFWLGEYSYFNLRLAPLAVLLLVAAAAPLMLSRASGLAVAVLTLGLLGHSLSLQWRLADEVAEIQPLIERVPPGSRLRRILHDAAPRTLDAGYFPQFHAHDVFHLQIARGGSSPYLFANALMPVRYNAAHSHWGRAEHAFDAGIGEAGDYDVLLVRGHGPVPEGLQAVAGSGAWTLYRR